MVSEAREGVRALRRGLRGEENAKTALNTPAVSASGEAYYIGDDPACLYLMGALGRSEDNAFLDEDLQSNAQGYARDGLAALQKRFPGVASRLNQSYELPDGSEWVPAEDDLVLYALARFGRLQSRGNSWQQPQPLNPSMLRTRLRRSANQAVDEGKPARHPRICDPAFQQALQQLYKLAYPGPVVGKESRPV